MVHRICIGSGVLSESFDRVLLFAFQFWFWRVGWAGLGWLGWGEAGRVGFGSGFLNEGFLLFLFDSGGLGLGWAGLGWVEGWGVGLVRLGLCTVDGCRLDLLPHIMKIRN